MATQSEVFPQGKSSISVQSCTDVLQPEGHRAGVLCYIHSEWSESGLTFVIQNSRADQQSATFESTIHHRAHALIKKNGNSGRDFCWLVSLQTSLKRALPLSTFNPLVEKIVHFITISHNAPFYNIIQLFFKIYFVF